MVMKKEMGVPALVLGLAMAILAGGCQTVAVKVEKVPKLEAVKIDDPAALAPIQLNRVGANIRRGTIIGSYSADPFVCARVADNLFWNQGPVKMDPGEFQALFFDTLSTANFNVVGDPEKLFAEAEREKIKPEFLVGGQIEDIRMNVCHERDFWTGLPRGALKGTASIRVSWQIFSVFDHKVVYQTQSSGSTALENAVAGGEGVLITNAFADAVANLAADAKLVELLKKRPRDVVDIRAVDATPLKIADRPPFDGPIADNIEAIRRAVVTLDSGSGHGSGFFISPTLILTNRHVVANNAVLRVRLVTGRKVLGEVIRQHAERDVALVQVEAAGHQPLPLRRQPLKVTEEVYAIGTPLDKDLAGTVTKGIVSKFGTNRYGLEDIQADVDIQGGNSGGPLLDARGNVVGISYAGIDPSGQKTSIGLNLFIPIADALDRLGVAVDPTRGRTVDD